MCRFAPFIQIREGSLQEKYSFNRATNTIRQTDISSRRDGPVPDESGLEEIVVSVYCRPLAIRTASFLLLTKVAIMEAFMENQKEFTGESGENSVTAFAGGLSYPIDKKNVLEKAQDEDESLNLLSILQQLPGKTFYRKMN